MKPVKLIVHEPTLNKIIGAEFPLQLDDKANLVDVISAVDRLIVEKGSFPLPEYQSLLHMIYNPVENRFYKQVAVAAYDEGKFIIDLRIDPKKALPRSAVVIVIPAGGCISEWEEAIGFDEFCRAVESGKNDLVA